MFWKALLKNSWTTCFENNLNNLCWNHQPENLFLLPFKFVNNNVYIIQKKFEELPIRDL